MLSLAAHRTWYTIRAACLAHGLGFNTNLTKEEGYDYVRSALLAGGRLRRMFKTLTENEREPLLTLQAAGGSLPLTEFTERFGSIRPYRPWREDAHYHPWKKPVSVAEKLWHLAFIEIIGDAVVMADEVLALLPPLPVPQPRKLDFGQEMSVRIQQGQALFCRDVAALLMVSPKLKWLHERWLSTASMGVINQQTYLKEELTHVTREGQTGRLRFLHYAAVVSGLLVDGIITARAWQWLSEDQQWQTVFKAVEADLRSRDPLWNDFGFQTIRPSAWNAVISALSRLPAGQAVERETVWAGLRHVIGRSELADLLAGPLSWLGLVVTAGESFIVTHAGATAKQFAAISVHRDCIDLQLPDLPVLNAWVELGIWAQAKDRILRIEPADIIRAAEHGLGIQQVTAALMSLSGAPVPKLIYEQLGRWFKAAQRLTLRPLLVLTVPGTSDMRSLRADWRLRPWLGEILSPQHVVVRTGASAELKRKLARRGFLIQEETAADDTTSTTVTEQEYAYLALRVYQMIGSFGQQVVPVPGRVVSQSARQIVPERREMLEQMAQGQLDNLRRVIQGQVSSASIEQENSNGIQAAVERALENQQTLTIRYFSPAHGEETVRTIRPIVKYDRNGATYVEAWCELSGDTRTFRLDRILGIIDNKET